MINLNFTNLFPHSFARLGFLKQVAAFSLVLLFFTQTATAQKAWGFACGVQTQGSPFVSGNLYDINLSSGAEILLGSPNCGGGTPALLTGEFVNGTFYALENNAKTLVTLASDGTCSVVGSLTGLSANHTVSGLSHNQASGITYAMSTDGTVTHLYTINLNTGALTFVGAIGGVNVGISLMIDDLGNAFVIDVASDQIFPLNLSTAVAGTGVALTDGVNPINLNFAQDADFDCGANGTIQGVLYTGQGNGRLGTLNPTTGVFVQTAFLGTEICAFSVDCGAPVPTMGEWGLLSFALLLLSVGLVFIQREQLVLAGDAASFRQSSRIPFHLPSFGMSLVLVLIAVLTGFAVAIGIFSYEVTAADLPGAMIASPIAAYLLHLLMGAKA